MAAVAIVGPSHAGKTVLLRTLVRDQRRYQLEPEILDLDERLGSNHRSDVQRAIDLVRNRIAAGPRTLLVDVGAGQLIQPAFRAFLQTEPGIVQVAVWCNESTFRSRHSPETAGREWRNNYSSELDALWAGCRERHQLVDTSAPRTVVESVDDLASIIRCIAAT